VQDLIDLLPSRALVSSNRFLAVSAWATEVICLLDFLVLDNFRELDGGRYRIGRGPKSEDIQLEIICGMYESLHSKIEYLNSL
jgi:hypothetical protein